MCRSNQRTRLFAFGAATVALLMAAANHAICGSEHWSFLPIEAPAVPQHRANDWATTPIDAYIAARLEREHLAPSAEADRATLIRRVTLDLTGLPPTPEEVDAFVDDGAPDAYERLVDRLLASPAYGERWARLWLDLCHYGDSDGHLTDQLRPVAWRYRDWVVQSLNDNLPFDEFTVRQIAGDLLEGRPDDAIMGTGFLRQTLSNREGGADLEEYRVAQVVDRTSMVGTIWLGLTIGCARCHDHKYDPISQEDFFRLYAFFDNADEVNIDAPLPGERDAWLASRPEYDRRRREILEPVSVGLAELLSRWEAKCLHAARNPGEDHVWDRQWELLGLIWGGNLGEGQLEGCEIVRQPLERRTARQRDDLVDYFLVHGAIIDPPRFEELKLVERREQLTKLRKEVPGATRAPVMRPALNPRATCVHERGDFRAKGPKVEPDAPGSLPALEPGNDPPRLALARWLVAADNPLTARVTVNRLWQELFGRGLVVTSNDFGARGDRPSHPELLDWLARQLIDSGWNVKHVCRLIVSSAVYRQSSHPRADVDRDDPENVLLARQSALRINAEAVRDSALAASGLLSQVVGGPGVRPPQPERVVMEAFGSNDWKVSEGGDRFRRGLYTFVLRTSPFAQAILFDAPTPIDVCTRRIRSNTPLQALTLLNDPAFFEMARGLAARVIAESLPSDRARIVRMQRFCLGRLPQPDETARLEAYLLQLREELAREPARVRDILGSDGAAAAASADEAALTLAASVLFNLHEFVTRP